MADLAGSHIMMGAQRRAQQSMLDKEGTEGAVQESRFVDLTQHIYGGSSPYYATGDAPAGGGDAPIKDLPDSSLKLIQILFLLCGLGTSMAWYSISGAVAYITQHYGDVYGTLLFVYNAPALLLLVAQTAEDDKYDRKYGSVVAYAFRTVLAFVVLACCVLGVMLIDHGTGKGDGPIGPLFVFVGIVGVFDSVGYGSLSQMASKLHPRVSTYMFTGQSTTSFLLLAYTLGLGFGATSSESDLNTYFALPLVFIAIGLFCFGGVLMHQPVRARLAFVDACATASDKAADEAAAGTVKADNPLIKDGAAKSTDTAAAAAAAESKGTDAEAPKAGADGGGGDGEVTVREAFMASWPMQVSCFLVMTTILTIQTFYAVAPSSSSDPETARSLGATLVYSKFAGEFLGKQVCAFRPADGGRCAFVTSPQRLLIATAFTPLMIVAFALYTSKSFGFYSDPVLVLGCTLFAGFEAYYVSLCYVFCASSYVPENMRAKSVSVLNLVLMLGILFGNQVVARVVRPFAYPWNGMMPREM